MRVVAQIDRAQIEQMTLDITLRMTVAEWRKLMDQVSSSYPGWEVVHHIRAVLDHIRKSTEARFTDPLHEADKPDA